VVEKALEVVYRNELFFPEDHRSIAKDRGVGSEFASAALTYFG
jgi:ABC-type long-subunit fatty acid transport system fused permease/ATPase subunit